MIKAVRGATCVKKDRPDLIIENTVSLIQLLVSKNKIEEKDIVSIMFTLTKDLKSYNPAAALRTIGFENVPLFCSQEAYVKGSLKKVIRVIITLNTDSDEKLIPIYINGAERLRPDLVCTKC